MNFARALVRDFVDKRLWPIAALLVVALIAVPLLLAGGGSAGAGAPLPAAAIDEGSSTASAAQTAPAVELVGPASVRARRGKVRDPFRRKPVVEKKAPGSTAPSTTGGAKAGAKAGASASKGSPASTPHAPKTFVPAAPKRTPFAYSTKVRFGWAQADGGKARGISRLTPLGGVAEPALLYLGVSTSGKYATFLLGPSANHTGEGICVDKACRVIGLKAGESAVVDVTPSTGVPRQYSLAVLSVRRNALASEAVAKKARMHVHPDGRGVFRELIRDGATAQAIHRIVYMPNLGVLVGKSAS